MSTSSRTVFLVAVDMNRPLRRYVTLQSVLMQKGLLVDMFVVAEGSWIDQLDPKLDKCSFIWIRSLESIKTDAIREKVLERVHRGKNVLITALPSEFSSDPKESDTYHLNRLTGPFGIRYTEIKIDSMTTGRWITLGFECLHHPQIFKDISSVSVASPWHLETETPAKPLITGDESCRGVNIDDRFVNLRGNQLVCGAYSLRSNLGKVVVLSSIMFMDSDDPSEAGTLGKNRQLASNLIDWLQV